MPAAKKKVVRRKPPAMKTVPKSGIKVVADISIQVKDHYNQGYRKFVVEGEFLKVYDCSGYTAAKFKLNDVTKILSSIETLRDKSAEIEKLIKVS